MSIFNSILTEGIFSIQNFLICIFVALVLGLLLALCSKYKSHYSKSMFISLAVLPAIVCTVILVVNGNIGVGVAIAGAFALVRFRSMPGDAKQIAFVFLSMAAGLVAGTGYIGYAILFVIIMCLVILLYTKLMANQKETDIRTLKITVPESLNFNDIFENTLKKYTDMHELTETKTANMGSMYKLTYEIHIRDICDVKEMIDELRCQNGNLEISLIKKKESNEL